MTAQAPDAPYCNQFEEAVSKSLNNVFKYQLTMNQHADGGFIVSELNNTHILVYYILDFLCAKNFVVQTKSRKRKRNRS